MAGRWTPGWPDHGPPDGPIMAPIMASTWPFMAFRRRMGSAGNFLLASPVKSSSPQLPLVRRFDAPGERSGCPLPRGREEDRAGLPVAANDVNAMAAGDGAPERGELGRGLGPRCFAATDCSRPWGGTFHRRREEDFTGAPSCLLSTQGRPSSRSRSLFHLRVELRGRGSWRGRRSPMCRRFTSGSASCKRMHVGEKRPYDDQRTPWSPRRLTTRGHRAQ